MEHAEALDRFLAGVERRAFGIARMALADDEDALDVVQDAMIRLVRRYASRPAGEWRPLFYRILNNGIRDSLRRRRVRRRVMGWVPGRRDDDVDPVQAASRRTTSEPLASTVGEDFELITSGDELETLDEDVEFYAWATGGNGNGNG